MRIERAGPGLCGSGRARHLAWLLVVAAALAAGGARAADEEESAAGWESWQANTSVADRASLQRGARNFVNFCLGCHSLQYARWSRIGADLGIPPAVLSESIVPVGDKATDLIHTTMPAADAETWFGKAPPDLTLMVRARGRDYVYQFLKTFYVDPTRPTGANNLRLPATAMPAVLSALEGLKSPVFKQVANQPDPVFSGFQQVAPGSLSPEEYDAFVKDTVNFLDYVSEPTQEMRRATGIWVVLFLLVFTWIAWLMKREYWKDVH
jgi:ubiquinol-cytochrome c reductase cytochrome c1 subunit